MTAARSIAEALGNSYRSGQWWRCRCPVHNSTGATLALRSVGVGLQVRCFARCSSAVILAELHRRGLIDRRAAASDSGAAQRQGEADARDRTRRIVAARWIWDETEPANWLIETYLGGRIILSPIPDTIRLHRALRHKEANCRRPAMVCAVEHAEDGFVGIHCTYLAPNGECKATAIEPVKRFIGPVGGGAVRLAPAADTVAVCEGIETGLSYMEATGTPTWAALSARGIRSLILPDHLVEVIIAADPDPVGIIAARAAAKRWLGEGRQVSIARPPLGLDFNDLALARLG
jgi:putative DNA primase/helicase